MGNTKSGVKQLSENTYSKVSDHLRDLANELIRLDTHNEGEKFVEVVNNLNMILYNILTKEISFSGKIISLDKDYKYIIHINTVKKWQYCNSLLKSCCIKMNENGVFAQTDEYSYFLRSLLAIMKYSTHQNKPIALLDLSNMDPSSIFKNQIDDFFAANYDNLKFPKNNLSQNNPPNSSSTSCTPPKNDHSSHIQPVNDTTHTSEKVNTIETPSINTKFSTIDVNIPKKRIGASRRSVGSRRLESERKVLLSNQNEGIRLVQELGNIWIIEIDGAVSTLYENETYTLRFTFEDNYPIESPEVVFVNTPPIHPHIYSDGTICLSILYDAWSPALGVVPICLSLISMLSSCKKKRKPDDDLEYSFKKNSKPKQTLWSFHDEKV